VLPYSAAGTLIWATTFTLVGALRATAAVVTNRRSRKRTGFQTAHWARRGRPVARTLNGSASAAAY